MNNERFAVPELLFHPSDIGRMSKNIDILMLVIQTRMVAYFELSINVINEASSSKTSHP